MDVFNLLYEVFGVGMEVALQKLWTRKVGPLALTGGMAEDLVCIVTGPTSGIGKEIAKELARRGAQVILACRSMDKGDLLCKEIHQEAEDAGGATPRVQAMQLDLSSLASVRAFAKAWEQSSRPIHVLINNAGIFSMASPRSETMDGLEAHIGTNHLGHFLLTLLLMPYLKAGSLGLGRPARVINVASRLHLMCGKINKDDPHMSTHYVSLQAYAQSKLAQVAFAAELTLRTKGEVIGVAVHPGEVTTDVVRSLPRFLPKLYKLIMGMILLTPSQGARSAIYCGTSPDLDSEKLKGVFYYDSDCKPGNPAPATVDAATREWLWNWSVQAVKLDSSSNLPPITSSRI